LIKEKILDFQKSDLYPLTPRKYETTFVEGMSFSITGPRCGGKTFRTYQFVKEYVEQGNSIENICRIQFNDHKLVKLKSENLNLIDAAYYELFPDKKRNREEEQTEGKQIDILLSRRVDGLIIASLHNTSDFSKYQEIYNHQIPCVFIDKYLKEVEIPSVFCDDVAGAFKATSYLIELGHEKIAFLSGPPHVLLSDNRMQGFKKAVKKYKIALNNDLIITEGGGFGRDHGCNMTQTLLSQKEKPTAIFAVNDVVLF